MKCLCVSIKRNTLWNNFLEDSLGDANFSVPAKIWRPRPMGTLMKSMRGFWFHLSKPSLVIGVDFLMNEKAYHTFFSFTLGDSWHVTFINSSFEIILFLIKPSWLPYNFICTGTSKSSNLQGKLGKRTEGKQNPMTEEWRIRRGEIQLPPLTNFLLLGHFYYPLLNKVRYTLTAKIILLSDRK